ncbi:hypothetical protein BO83DRAFT_374973 [Aspergillus eucalypticola CBS 122712]|uniref:Uncharacterized protein n=1 Tax=Aspergillus eucalypticola (strain CBS 122712 / IBT 29274) TaxID=1448314 RepID=A0A317W768_ASPEC|nr:uncharacterized protein BO83DRAFT_374973 [Aspergillus eucalypticola CBS 122712]PWY82496.1 hypothetical protein BO83DRAFT_374973 [Aspergillus eucalypticola CBS 122712]
MSSSSYFNTAVDHILTSSWMMPLQSANHKVFWDVRKRVQEVVPQELLPAFTQYYIILNGGMRQSKRKPSGRKPISGI